MSKAIGSYPSPTVDTTGIVSHAGATLLTSAVAKTGLDRALSRALARWRQPNVIHDPGKIVCDLAIMLARETLRADLVAAVDHALTRERREQEVLVATNDFREGVRAHAERRQPRFTGS